MKKIYFDILEEKQNHSSSLYFLTAFNFWYFFARNMFAVTCIERLN